MLGILPTLPENFGDPEQVAIAAHCVHHIRTLLQLSDDTRGRVFVITSPSAGSGKTSLTTALGLSFATSDARTLLIDCDVVGGGLTRRMASVVRRPLHEVLRQQGKISESTLREARLAAEAAHRPLGDVLLDMGRLSREDLVHAMEVQAESSMGLLDACEGEPLETCITETGIDNLFILPLGSALPHQAGALSPKAIRKVLAQAREKFDTVLLDTGPILGSIEASMGAAEADGTVLVVSRGDQKMMVVKSLEHLRSVGSTVAGIVFNHASADDVEHSSYASVASVSSRSAGEVPSLDPIDAVTSARFGPVGSAVASCSARSRRGSNNHHTRNGVGVG